MRLTASNVLLIGLLVLFSGCGDCAGSPGQIATKTGEAMQYETIGLGIGAAEFLKKAAEVGGIDNAAVDPRTSCRGQLIMSVPELSEEVVEERPKGPHSLSNCVVRTTTATQSTSLLEIRGEFVDERLARLSFRVTRGELARLRQRIEARFGPGARMTLTETLIVDEVKTDTQIWSEANEIWLLSQTDSGTALFVHQDMALSDTLPRPPKAVKRGEPVSLEDIGIGKLDLNAPEPALDIPDAGGAGAGEGSATASGR